MKIAVLYSGICRGNWLKNNGSVRFHFPDADYHFATWSSKPHTMPAVQFKTQIEPEMHYHPLVDVPPEQLTPKLIQNKKLCAGQAYYERTLHHTKQILAHGMQLAKLEEEYDLIVRVRYDTYLSPKVDFKPWMLKSVEENCAVGFGTRTQRHRELYKLEEVPKLYLEGDNLKKNISQDWSWYLVDPMIFHPPKLFDVDYMWKLHKEKKLMVAENGWYQVLSEPYGDNHYSVYGGAQIEKYLGQTML